MKALIIATTIALFLLVIFLSGEKTKEYKAEIQIQDNTGTIDTVKCTYKGSLRYMYYPHFNNVRFLTDEEGKIIGRNTYRYRFLNKEEINHKE